MHFSQIYTPGIAQCSYVIGSGRKCVVVDPVRADTGVYLRKAKEFGMEISGVLETHLHADFLSGHMELADITGAVIYAPGIANCTFPHHALADEEEFTVENLKFKLLETPGHTPDCTVYLVTDLERGEEPVLAFTGDTLMVGDVGRPDLFPNREEELAEKLFYSLKRLKELPDHIEVYPAHGMGSLCGRALSAKLWSTMGTEKRYNYGLQHTELEAFKVDLLTGMPAAPDHFARCSEINRTGPRLLRNLVQPRAYSAAEVNEAIKEAFSVIDMRSYHSFAGAHIPGSYSISKYGNPATFAGWVVPPEVKLILVLENGGDVEEMKTALYNVGLDNIHGYLEGSIESWVNAGMPAESVSTLAVHELKKRLDNKEDLLLLDNRARSEWESGHIEGAILAPAPDMRRPDETWNPEQEVIVHCNTSNRSMTAASLLKQKGFKKVTNVLGGTTAWGAAGLPFKKEGEK